jgi:thiol-disulfide isomerase/thioredoxin
MQRAHLLTLALGGLLAGCATTRPAPDFTLATLAGDPLHATDLTGKVVVLDFWASWCGPCLHTFPVLQEVYQDYEQERDVVFLVVNTSWNDTPDQARAFLVSNQFFLPGYWDEGGRTAEAFGVRGIPATFVIGRDGVIQYRKEGFGGRTAYERTLRRAIEEALAAPPADSLHAAAGE